MEKKKSPTENSKKKKENSSENSKKDTSKENKILTYTLLISGAIIIFILFFALYVGSLKTFDYKGTEFETVSFGDLIIYQTTIETIYEGRLTPYNLYIRTKPSKLKRIDFPEENFSAMKFTVLNAEEEVSCDGDEVIAIANILQVHDAIGAKIMKDENATCDEEGRYIYLTVKSSDKTQVKEVGPNCYDLEFSNCEILPVTEKYLAELIAYYNSI